MDRVSSSSRPESHFPAPTVAVFYRRLVPSDDLAWSGDSAALVGRDAAPLPSSFNAWQERIHPDDREQYRLEQADFAARRDMLRSVYRVRADQGAYRRVAEEAVYLDADKVVGTIRLVNTPRLHQATELELVRFFELSLDLFCIANLDGYFVRVNSNFSRVLGYEEDELLTRPFLDFVHPDDRPPTIAAMSNLSSGQPVVQFRNRYLDVYHEYHWLEWTARSVPTEGIFYAVARDVTEARLAEAQRIARVGSWEWRIGSDQIWWSDEYYRILGLVPDQTASPDVFYARAHIDDHEAIRRWAAASIEGEIPQNFSFRIIRPDGVERVLWTEARLERDADGKPFRLLGTCQDITERRRALEEKQLLERKLQEAQKLESLGVLAGGIAHDFNNLLSAILGNASLMGHKLPGDSPLRPCLNNILQASDRAAALCRQMLAYSGRGRFVLANVDLNKSIVEMIGLLKISIGKKVALQLDLAEKLPTILADASQIGQVIMNLVINASEAIGDRHGVIRIVTCLCNVDHLVLGKFASAHDLTEGSYILFEVTDTGCGMDEETRRKIFEPFFTTKFTGRGLGLAAVLGIVRGHQGALQVESVVGQGTTFRLLLRASGDVAEIARRQSGASERWQGEGTVLIADDDRLVCETAALMLRSLGFRVVEAPDGEEALARFREASGSFCLVLLDLTMPKLDGEEVFRTLQALRPQLPVVLMSGYSEMEATGRFAGSGLAGFLAKPFKFDELVASVRTALDLTRAAKPRPIGSE